MNDGTFSSKLLKKLDDSDITIEWVTKQFTIEENGRRLKIESLAAESIEDYFATMFVELVTGLGLFSLALVRTARQTTNQTVAQYALACLGIAALVSMVTRKRSKLFMLDLEGSLLRVKQGNSRIRTFAIGRQTRFEAATQHTLLSTKGYRWALQAKNEYGLAKRLLVLRNRQQCIALADVLNAGKS